MKPKVAVPVESEQAFSLSRPVVSMDVAGARRLGSAYWEEVERTTRRFVQARPTRTGVDLRVLRRGPLLLRLGPPQLDVRVAFVSCSHSVLGGLLARSEGGVLLLAQERSDSWNLRTSIRGYLPRLGAPPGRPGWTGFLYAQLQARLHRAIGRRYAVRLMREARR